VNQTCLYLICCLGLLRLRARNVRMAGEPFRAPGGALVPLIVCAIIGWMLMTLSWQELVGLLSIMTISGITYALQQRRLPAVSSTEAELAAPP
jgi:basic amino acid/polyamine antiporter, APA family